MLAAQAFVKDVVRKRTSGHLWGLEQNARDLEGSLRVQGGRSSRTAARAEPAKPAPKPQTPGDARSEQTAHPYTAETISEFLSNEKGGFRRPPGRLQVSEFIEA
jgi:hypothetical protein